MSRFEQFIYGKFGISLPAHICIEERKDKVYAYESGLNICHKRVQRRGLLAGKLNTLYGIKPSLDFTLAFGALALKNCITFSTNDIKKLYHNECVETQSSCCDDGLVIVKDENGRGAALAIKIKSKVQPLIQKSRLLRSCPEKRI